MLCSSIQTCHNVTAFFLLKRQPSNSLAIEGTTAQLDDLYMSYAVESSWLGCREDLLWLVFEAILVVHVHRYQLFLFIVLCYFSRHIPVQSSLRMKLGHAPKHLLDLAQLDIASQPASLLAA